MTDAELEIRGPVRLLYKEDRLHVSETSQLNCQLGYEARKKLEAKLQARAEAVGIVFNAWTIRWLLDCEVKDNGVYFEGERIADEVPSYTFCGIR